MYVAPHRSLHRVDPWNLGSTCPVREVHTPPLRQVTFPISYTPLGLEVPRSSDIRRIFSTVSLLGLRRISQSYLTVAVSEQWEK